MRQLYATCLNAVRPVLHLLLAHGVEYLAELLDVGIGVILWFYAFETVQLLVVKIKVAVVVTFFAVGVLATAHAVLAVVMVVALLGCSGVPVKPAQYEHTAG